MLAHVAMVRDFGLEPLPWGGSALRNPDAKRKAYVDALVAAAHRDITPLLGRIMTRVCGELMFRR
jgi:hypothetical protein